VIVALGERPRRYSELLERIGGVSKKMLTQTLHKLEPTPGRHLCALDGGADDCALLAERQPIVPAADDDASDLASLERSTR
jgi:hypothetical protein